ncbi:MAG: hypothetical protein Q9177_003673 [Variospora cf. flavescens]
MLGDIRNVAVIGAGPAGIATAKQLLAENHFETIDVFEQQASTGGVWNYNSFAPSQDLSIPQTSPHQPLEEPIWECPGPAEQVQPIPLFVTPMYDRLESNIPNFLMKHSDDSSLEDQPLFAGHEGVLEYLNRYAEGVRHLVKFKSQVYDVRLENDNGKDQWLVCTRDLVSSRVTEKIYDAVVVASGHHYVPTVPDIPGIQKWNEAYPGTITHSKYYRTPDAFKDKTVLVVGNSASGIDIATQISTVSALPLLNSKRSEAPEYQRTAPWKREMPEIAEFLPPSASFPRAVRFTNNEIECSIEAIVFCTGYYYSFPFLSSLCPPVIVTGERVESIYNHLFSIPHPTLAFIGLPYKIVPFRTYEGQAAVVTRVWSGRLSLPPDREMRAWEAQRIQEKGAGKKFHELTNLEDFRYHNEMVDWALKARPGKGDESTVPPRWSKKDEVVRKNIPAIKRAFAEMGQERFAVGSLEELGMKLG